MRTLTIVLAGVIGGQNATIPDCFSGELLVSKGQGQFECVSPSRALALSNCQSGDFITLTGSELKCDRPQKRDAEYAAGSAELLERRDPRLRWRKLVEMRIAQVIGIRAVRRDSS